MEPEIKSKNKGMKFLIIMVIIILLATIGGLVFLVLNNSENEPTGNIVTNEEIINEIIENTVVGNVVVPNDLKEYPMIGNGQIAEEKSAYYDRNKERAVIPTGYAVLNDSPNIADGLVISDIANDNMANQMGGNQFVWIPVAVPYIDVTGQLEDTAINNRIQEYIDVGYYPMAIKLKDDNYASILYNFRLGGGGTRVSVALSKYTSEASEGNREPQNVVTDGNIRIRNWEDDLFQKEYNDMVEAVIADGGFWIARFGTSINDNNIAQSKRGQEAVFYKTWYDLYDIANSLSNNITKTHMIWGCQWDQTMIFLAMEGNKYATEGARFYILNGTGKGNFAEYETELTKAPKDNPDAIIKLKNEIKHLPTGFDDEFQVKSIYDLAGNLWEWTMEGTYETSRAMRGGFCGYNGSQSAAAREYVKPDYYGERIADFGTRMVLYEN